MRTQWMAWMASGLMLTVPFVSLTQLFPALVGVPLTPTQQTQLERLSDQILPQVQQLLSPAQQSQFKAALAQGKGVRAAALSLNLSITQRMQILKTVQPLRSQINTILTPEQQQQVQQNNSSLTAVGTGFAKVFWFSQ
jgi:Spy/CpxP family protein refolding chaperone